MRLGLDAVHGLRVIWDTKSFLTDDGKSIQLPAEYSKSQSFLNLGLASSQYQKLSSNRDPQGLRPRRRPRLHEPGCRRQGAL